MTFTPHQIEALNALEGEFGPVDPMLHNVTSGEHVHGPYGYQHWITRSLTDALRSWGQYKYAMTVDWEEKARLDREAREAAWAERSVEKRESMMLAFMAGLMPKINRALPDSDAELEINDETFSLTVTGWKYRIEMEYTRNTFSLITWVCSEGHDVFNETEDMTLVHGNARPRDQIKGYAAVVDFLDGEGIDTLT